MLGFYGQEFWYACELQSILEYTKCRNFYNVIEKAMLACRNSGNNNTEDHSGEVNKMIELPKNAGREVLDYQFSRYACYLIVMNAEEKHPDGCLS